MVLVPLSGSSICLKAPYEFDVDFHLQVLEEHAEGVLTVGAH